MKYFLVTHMPYEGKDLMTFDSLEEAQKKVKEINEDTISTEEPMFIIEGNIIPIYARIKKK